MSRIIGFGALGAYLLSLCVFAARVFYGLDISIFILGALLLVFGAAIGMRWVASQKEHGVMARKYHMHWGWWLLAVLLITSIWLVMLLGLLTRILYGDGGSYHEAPNTGKPA